jgi:hypothetical protein
MKSLLIAGNENSSCWTRGILSCRHDGEAANEWVVITPEFQCVQMKNFNFVRTTMRSTCCEVSTDLGRAAADTQPFIDVAMV